MNTFLAPLWRNIVPIAFVTVIIGLIETINPAITFWHRLAIIVAVVVAMGIHNLIVEATR